MVLEGAKDPFVVECSRHVVITESALSATATRSATATLPRGQDARLDRVVADLSLDKPVLSKALRDNV
jgi:hypothetical protein